MKRDILDLWVFIAWAVAWITLIAVLFLIYHFGQIEVVDPRGFLPRIEKVINWPLIVGCVASTIYAFLFAAMFGAVRHAACYAQDAITLARLSAAPEPAATEAQAAGAPQ